MAFPETVIEQAWDRAAGRCECVNLLHKHPGRRCPNKLKWTSREKPGLGPWQAGKADPSGGDVLSNCIVFCWSCFRRAV